MLRLSVVIHCGYYRLRAAVEMICWDYLLRAAVASWDCLLRFLLWSAAPVASQDDLLGSADRGSVVVSCCEDLLWSAVEIICWEQLLRILVESSWWDYLLRLRVVVSWDYLLLFSVVISCCDYQSSNLVISCWDYQLRRSVVISCVAYLLRSVVENTCWEQTLKTHRDSYQYDDICLKTHVNSNKDNDKPLKPTRITTETTQNS